MEAAESLSKNLYVFYTDNHKIVRALKSSDKVRREEALMLSELESIQPGVGSELLKEGIRESLGLGLNGRIFYYSTKRALPFHQKLAEFAGAIQDGNEFYYNTEAANKLLSYPIRTDVLFYPPRLLAHERAVSAET